MMAEERPSSLSIIPIEKMWGWHGHFKISKKSLIFILI